MKLAGAHAAKQLTRAIPFILFLKLIKGNELDSLGQNISKQPKDRQLSPQRYYSESEKDNVITHRTGFEWLSPGSSTSLRFLIELTQKETSVDIQVYYCGTAIGGVNHATQPIDDEGCMFLFTTHAGRPEFVKNDIRLDRFNLSMKIVTPISHLTTEERNPGTLIAPHVMLLLIAFKNHLDRMIHELKEEFGDMDDKPLMEHTLKEEPIDTFLPIFITDKLQLTNDENAKKYWRGH